MRDIERVKQYMKGGQGAPSVQHLAPFLQLIHWCHQHTAYTAVSSRCLPSRPPRPALPCLTARLPAWWKTACQAPLPARLPAAAAPGG